MGNITNGGNEIKSNFFGCSRCEGEKNLCSNPNTYGEIKIDELPVKNIYEPSPLPDLNYFKSPEMQNIANKYVRAYSLENKNNNSNYDTLNINLFNYTNLINTNYKEENIAEFNTEKLEKNPKILELLQLIGETNINFKLTEKELFKIKTDASKKNLIQKLFHYRDNSYYLGFVNKKHNKELFGTYYYNDGSIYKGFFENDKINGRGRLMLINKYIYEGDFVDELFHGFGKIYSLNNLKYEGNWKNNLQEGYGIESYPDGSYYSGMFKKGMKHGKGKFVFKNKDIYEGDFENEEMTGWGLYKRTDGRMYYGMVKNHFIEGIGIFIWKDNKKYIGEYKNELKDGFGIFYTNNGKNYAGFWKAGKQDGYGVITNIYGDKYYVKFNNGEKINMPNITEQEKLQIDEKILEGEKRINLGKLYVIANELIQEREREKKKEEEESKKNENEKNEYRSDIVSEKKKYSTSKHSKFSLISINNNKLFHRGINKSISLNDNNLIKDMASNSNQKENTSHISSDNQIYFNKLNDMNNNNIFYINNNINKINFINFNNKSIQIKDKDINNKNKKNNSSPNLINNSNNLGIQNLDKNKNEVKTKENSYYDYQDFSRVLNNYEPIKHIKI